MFSKARSLQPSRSAPQIHTQGQQSILRLLVSIACSPILHITLAGYESKGREEEAGRGSVNVPVNEQMCLRLFLRLFQCHRLLLSGHLV